MDLRSPPRLLPLLALLALACGPSLIPGTPISDTEDNREILEVLRQYKNAFEARDAKAIADLASPRYLDPRDSISKDTLEKELAKDFEKVKDARLDIQVRKIDVEKEHAQVEYFYSSAFLINAPGADWQRESDDKRMTLERTDQGWKVLSGF